MNDTPHPAALEIGDHRVQSSEVAVHVRDDRELHVLKASPTRERRRRHGCPAASRATRERRQPREPRHYGYMRHRLDSAQQQGISRSAKSDDAGPPRAGPIQPRTTWAAAAFLRVAVEKAHPPRPATPRFSVVYRLCSAAARGDRRRRYRCKSEESSWHRFLTLLRDRPDPCWRGVGPSVLERRGSRAPATIGERPSVAGPGQSIHDGGSAA